MYFCVFEEAGTPQLGGTLAQARTEVVNLTSAWPQSLAQQSPCDVLGLIDAGAQGLETARQLLESDLPRLETAGLKLLAPILRPRKNVFCVGRNYRQHIIEGNIARGEDPNAFPEHIEFFTKAPTTVIGHQADIPLHAGVTALLDYEVELGVIMGGEVCNISQDAALESVFGYTIINDVTGRDLQRRHGQWFKGKTLDGTCPMGPWVVHRSALPDAQSLTLTLAVNGEERQRDNTASMIFPIPAIIAQLSQGMTLEPGDVIATGTPSGVGYAMKPPRPLQDGDHIVLEIEKIGRLENTVRKQSG